MANGEDSRFVIERPSAAGGASDDNRFVIERADAQVTMPNLLRSFVGQGVAFGFGDEIEARVRSMFGDETYEQELAQVRDQLRAFREQNPGTAITSEVIGSFVAPGGAIGAGLRLGSGLVRGAVRGLAAGGVGGALSGAGTAEGDLGDRLSGAALGGIAGAGLGAAAAPVIQGLGRAAQVAGRQLTPRGVREQGIETVTQALGRDRVTADDLLTARRGLPGDVDDATIADLAQLATPQGGAASVLRTGRAAAGIEGPGSSRAAEFLGARQAAQGQEIANFIDDTLGTRNFDVQSRALSENLARQADQAYDALHSLPDVPMTPQLANFFRNPRVRQSYRRASADAFDETGEALPPFNETLQATQVPVRVLDWMQRRMRRETDAAFRSGEASAGPRRALRERFLGIIDPQIQGFEGIRRAYADGRAAEEALDAGQRFVARLGANQRAALREYDQMQPVQQRLFQLGFAQRINDEVLNATQGTDLGSRFLRPGSQRQILRIFGNQQGQRLIDRMEVAQAQTRTQRSILQGSRTAPLTADIERGQELARTASNVLTGNVLGIAQDLGTRLARGINERNADEVIQILLETRPGQQTQILDQIRAADQAFARQLSRRLRAGFIGAAGAGQLAGRETSL